MVGVEYDLMAHTSVSDGDMNPIGIMVGLNIPIWWQKYAAGVREARWRHSLAVHAKAALVNSLSADVEMALFEFQDAGRKINLYRDTLIPKAAQALQAAQIAYAATKVGFQDYLDAQRVLLEFQLSYERSLADRTQRMAELEMLVGKRLPVSAPQGP
jgi:outer membrane protein TolC